MTEGEDAKIIRFPTAQTASSIRDGWTEETVLMSDGPRKALVNRSMALPPDSQRPPFADAPEQPTFGEFIDNEVLDLVARVNELADLPEEQFWVAAKAIHQQIGEWL